MSYYGYCDFSELNGKVFDSVTSTDKEVIFKCGSLEYKLHHFQDCCESVYVEDIVGDLAAMLHLTTPNMQKAISKETALAISLVAGVGFEPTTFRL